METSDIHITSFPRAYLEWYGRRFWFELGLNVFPMLSLDVAARTLPEEEFLGLCCRWDVRVFGHETQESKEQVLIIDNGRWGELFQ